MESVSNEVFNQGAVKNVKKVLQKMTNESVNQSVLQFLKKSPHFIEKYLKLFPKPEDLI